MADLNATSGMCLIAKQDPCFVQKSVPEIEILHLSVSSNNNASPRIKGLCIDEDLKCFEQILVEDDKFDNDIYSSLNLPKMDVKSVLMEDMTDSSSSEDLKPSTLEGLGSFEKVFEQNVGDEEVSSPVSTYFHETSKPAMNDLRSLVDNGNLAEHCYSSETSAGKIPSEQILEPKTKFLQGSDTDFLQVDSSSQNDNIDENQDPRGCSYQVTEQDDKLTMTSPMQAKECSHIEEASPKQAKECSQIEETINKDLFEENKSCYDVEWESRDTFIAGNERKVGNNQQNVQKRIDVRVEDPIIDSTISAGSSLAHLIHEEPGFLGSASLLSPTTTSGHIPYSGNISHRSDSSTTSTQSFAFPILQSEWNSSPVKMAKADRRQLRKHRWRTKIMCCKF